MQARHVITDDRARFAAIENIKSLSSEDLHEVVIKPFKKDRSLAMNRLSHLWYRERADADGTDAKYEKSYCKLQYGCPILIADDEDFATFYRAAIEPLSYENKIKAMEYFPVTSLMNSKQMHQYLTDVDNASGSRGIRLTHPEDLYYEAMGVVA